MVDVSCLIYETERLVENREFSIPLSFNLHDHLEPLRFFSQNFNISVQISIAIIRVQSSSRWTRVCKLHSPVFSPKRELQQTLVQCVFLWQVDTPGDISLATAEWYAWEWEQLGSHGFHEIPIGMGVTMTIMGMEVEIKVWEWE